MSIAQLSPASVNANPGYINPTAKLESNANTVQNSQSAHSSAQSLKTDTVTLSPQALLMSSKANGQQDESKQNGPDKDFGSGRK